MENMMEFTMDRDLFLPVLKRICAVSKSGAKDYERYGMISLKAEKERVLVSASNGYIHAVCPLPMATFTPSRKSRTRTKSLSSRLVKRLSKAIFCMISWMRQVKTIA